MIEGGWREIDISITFPKIGVVCVNNGTRLVPSASGE
jgi:hypothetical protein